MVILAIQLAQAAFYSHNAKEAMTGTSDCVFNAAQYSSHYPDLQNAFKGNAAQLKQHYIQYGINEGRTPCGAMRDNCKFVADKYSSYYPDLQAAFNGNAAQLKEHYIRNGINEGRIVCKGQAAGPILPKNVTKQDFNGKFPGRYVWKQDEAGKCGDFYITADRKQCTNICAAGVYNKQMCNGPLPPQK